MAENISREMARGSATLTGCCCRSDDMVMEFDYSRLEEGDEAVMHFVYPVGLEFDGWKMQSWTPTTLQLQVCGRSQCYSSSWIGNSAN